MNIYITGGIRFLPVPAMEDISNAFMLIPANEECFKNKL